ncbi:uncharacterized protein LOC142984030 isoform X2 [Anticarsia gemmatalis]|uniref:uncharacterized protein LOC142984030 isoform X2 n=1 Tax=Anticarsia gemmatalis TaxID=129554 RepID=UPI003F75B293
MKSFFLVLVLYVSANFVTALSSNEELEITDTCCAHAEAASLSLASAAECAGVALPDDIEPEQVDVCKAALTSCCEQQFQFKDECTTGIKFAASKRCSVPDTDMGKSCCDECSFGKLTGESGGAAACGAPVASEDISPSTALKKNAFVICCLEAAENMETTTKKEATTPEEPKTTLEPKKDKCQPDSCQHICDDEGGVVRCSCESGYRLQPDKKTCKEDTVCHNTAGAFKCVPIKKRDVGLTCPPGFKRNLVNQVCDDINECQLPRPPCPKYLCENTIGAYKCAGKPGKPYTEAVPGAITEPTVTSSTASPKNDICPPGFRAGPDDECLDIDECDERLDDCQRLSQHCINTHGGFFCQDHVSKRCAPGFKVNVATGICEDIDECEESSEVCKRTEVCINLPGAYNCKSKISTLPKLATKTCQEGTRVRPGGSVCEDIDECREGSHLCDQFQNCINTYGGHECRCKNGFELDSSSGSCVDINECLLKLDNCGPGQHCLNLLGTFTCTRRAPTTSTTTSTQPPPLYEYEYYDSDEDNSTIDSPYPEPIATVPTTSSTTTTTTTTRRPTTTSTTTTTTTTTPKPTTTSTTTTTTTTPRPRPEHPYYTYYPVRPRPSSPSSPDNTTTFRRPEYPRRPYSEFPRRPEYPRRRPEPRPSEEPTNHDSSRDEVSRPEPTRPEYPRPEPTRPDTVIPRPEPRPAPPPEPRPSPAPEPSPEVTDDRRTNEIGGENPDDDFNPNEVHCLDGYVKNDEGRCVDDDECASGQHACRNLEVCVNKPGGYVCECVPGFRKDGNGWCIPLPASTSSTTTTTSTTTETAVSVPEYQPPPYRPSRPYGRYPATRNCEMGYKFDPRRNDCVDIDECATNTATCSPREDCINIPGGFRCECGWRCRAELERPSYNMTPATTTPPPRMPSPGDSRSIITVGAQYGQRGPYSPRPIYSRVPEVGAVIASCPWGYKLTPEKRCYDIDECARNTSECGPQQRCENFYGGYSCQCPAGHRLVGQNQCEDINECMHGNPCPYNADCMNTYGSYRCVCREGFRNAPSNDKVCVDLDECAETPDVCSQACSNTWGSYRCYCKKGYRLDDDNKTCIDVNECEEYSAVRLRGKLCGGECINIPGSYRCDCPRGYRLSEDSRSCIDIDECESGEARCGSGPGAVCQNTRGSYHCHHIECPPGYHLESKHRCARVQRSCQVGDWSCLQQPSAYSYNFITFVANIYLPSGSVDLFTMHGPAWRESIVSFEMRMVNVQASLGAKPADFRCFDMRPSGNICVISLLCSLEGPQVVELELTMSLYQRSMFAGSAVARLVVIVSEYDY